LNIEIVAEREGLWLEFLLKEDEKMFEEEIAERRERIFKNKDQTAIEEMKQILNAYAHEKEQIEREEAETLAAAAN
jgi:hypothetical protein